MGVDNKKRFLNEVIPDGLNQVTPKDFPGKVIPAGNGANIMVTSLD